MATVKTIKRTDPSGKLRTTYRVYWRDPSGTQRQQTFPLKKLADDWAVKAEHGKRSGSYADPSAGRITFAAYAETWMATKRAMRKASTVTAYGDKLRSHILPTLGGKTLAGTRRSDVQALVNVKSAQLAPSTTRAVYAVVAMIFAEAVRDKLIPASPCDRIDLPALVRTKVSPLTPEQVYALAEAITPCRYRAIVLVGAGTGLRRSELLGLTVDRVDFLRRIVTVDRQLASDEVCVDADGLPLFTTPKTVASTRTVPLPQVVADTLAAHLAEYGPGPGGLLFSNTGRGTKGMPSAAGRVIRKNSLYEAWDRAVAKAGLPDHTTPHALRHTYAAWLIAANEGPKVIQARLGHATISETFDTYGHLFPASEDKTRSAIDAAMSQPGAAPSDERTS